MFLYMQKNAHENKYFQNYCKYKGKANTLKAVMCNIYDTANFDSIALL